MLHTIARTVIDKGCAVYLTKKNFCVFIVLISMTVFVYGQAEESDLRAQHAINTQTVLPGSPEASSLGEYGNIPVTAYTGTANISIPIYTIAGHRIGLSINANYATGGIKVEDRGSGSLGVGWALSAGGSISRAVKAAPDMHYNYYDHACIFEDYYLQTDESFELYDFYYDVVRGKYETQPDSYNYSFNGRNGKFYIDADKNVIQNEDSDLKIDLSFVNATASLQVLGKITITDETGTVYTFEDAERTSVQYDDSATGLDGAIYFNHEYNSSWHLSRIESYDGTESILFHYDVASTAYQVPINIDNYKARNFTVNLTGDSSCTGLENTTGTTVTASVDQLVLLNRHYLADIEYWVGGKVESLEFYYSPNGCNYAIDLDQQLDSIKIYKGVDAATHQLSHYFDYDCLDERLFLLQTGIRSAGNPRSMLKPPFAFNYDPQALPSPLSKSQDNWGYFNGKDNTSLIPGTDIPGISWIGADRTSVPSKAVARSLVRVTYPTGGFTQYSYEGNTIPNPDLTFTVSDCSPSPCAIYESCKDDFSDCDGDLCVEPSQNRYSVRFNSSLISNGYFEIYSEYLCGDGPQPFTQPAEFSDSISLGLSWTGTASLFLYRESDNFQVGAYSKSFTTPDFTEVIKISDHFDIAPGINYILDIQGVNTRTRATTKIGTYSTSMLNEQIGGVRLSKIVNYDRNGVFMKGKAYDYTDELGSLSSGIVIAEPQFQEIGTYTYEAPNSIPPCNVCCFYNYTTVRLTAGPSFPMGSFDGSFYGYSRVEEIDILDSLGAATEGKTVYHFHNEKKTGDVVDVASNGKLKLKEYYNVSGQLVKDEQYEYAFDIGETQRETSFYGFQIVSKSEQDNLYFMYHTSMGEYFWTNNVATQANEISRKVYKSKWDRSTTDYLKLVNYSTFNTKQIVTHYFYDNSGSLTNQIRESITNDYSSNLDVLQPSKTTTINSNGDKHEVYFSYPSTYSLANPIKILLIEKNLILPAWQTEHVYNNEMIDGTRTKWGFFKSGDGEYSGTNTGLIYPHEVYRFERTWEPPTIGNAVGDLEPGTWDLQLTANDYDRVSGRPEKTRRNHWSFDNIFVYDSSGNRLKHSFGDYEQSWTYHPEHYLLETEIAIDGTSISYSWDELLRLKRVKDNSRNVITNVEHNYGDNCNSIKRSTTYPRLGTHHRTLTDFDYYDDLGRHFQTRKKSQGPSESESVIYGKSYDKIGRIQYEYEPQAVNDADTPISLNGDRTSYVYEKSPLNRRQEILSAELWFRTRFHYGANDAGEVSAYPKGSLYKETQINGNDSMTIVFTDKRGNEVLKRRFNNGLAHDTYTQLDGKDRPVLVIPPGAGLSDTDLTFRWTYHPTDKLESEYIPGKGLTEYRYNRRGLPMYVRDPKQNANQRWRAFTFDDYGHSDKEGWRYFSENLDDENAANATIDEIKVDVDFGATGISTGKKIKSVVQEINNNSAYTSYQYYDAAGRLASKEFNHLISPDDASLKEYFNYDSADNIIRKLCDYTRIESSPIKYNMSKDYDHAGRLIREWYGQNSSPQHKLASYSYTAKDELNQLSLGQGIQSIDFLYLKNGLLHTINGDNLSGDDVFQQELFYHLPMSSDAGVTGRMNGDVSSWEWLIKGESSFYYNNKYDGLDRLIASYGNGSATGEYSAEYNYDMRSNLLDLTRRDSVGDYIDSLQFTYSTGNRLETIYDHAGVLNNLGFNSTSAGSNYNYDLNGNITGDESRQLTSVYNHLNLPDRHIETISNYIDRIYDDNGLLLHKRSRDNGGPVIDIDYVGDVEFENGQLRRIHHQNGYIEIDSMPVSLITLTGVQSSDTVEYHQTIFSNETITNSSMVDYYAEDCLELLPEFSVEEGSHFLADYKPYGKENFYWILKDHLGNTRVILDNETNIIEKHSYYPFGMRWQQSISPGFDHTYNGKEEQTGVANGLLDYGARIYDSSIARFMSVDRFADIYNSMSAYQYGANSPMKFIDINGDSLVAVVLPGLNSQHPTVKQRHFFVEERIAENLVGFVHTATSKFEQLSVNNVFRGIPSSQIKTKNLSSKKLSRHQGGFAIDFNGVKTLNKNQLSDLNTIASEFGFNPLKNQHSDLPHFSADPQAHGFSSLNSAVIENKGHFDQIVNSRHNGALTNSPLTDKNGNVIGIRFVKGNNAIHNREFFSSLIQQLTDFAK